MLRVLLVDDEPFILQGLKAIINWEEEGYEIVGMCANGQEAYEYLKKNEVDIIIADIKMPFMTGIELLEKIRTEDISEAFFVILTGFKDFSYVKTAMRYSCLDYLLKPVDKTELTGILRKVAKVSDDRIREEQTREDMREAYLARNLISVLTGKFDDKNIDYVQNHLKLSDDIRYVDVEMTDIKEEEELEEGELKSKQRRMFKAAQDYLNEEKNHCIFDVSRDERSYDLGLIYCDFFAAKREITMNDFLKGLQDYIRNEAGISTNIFVGKSVGKINALSKSYSSACMLKSLEAFRSRKNIYYYENEISADNNKVVILKEKIDNLVNIIEQGDEEGVTDAVNNLYNELNSNASKDTERLNVNYLLFQLIHVATKLDSDIDQEDVLRFIAENSSAEGILRGSNEHMIKFAREYSNYLSQLRKNVSGGILLEIEKEIRERYAENLTLRDLGRKYFINSSYLGQIFQKKYNQSFKDYLTGYRITIAESMLLNTDKRIAEIAEEVGYKDSDYFLKRFIETNGCTPSKYRKTHM